MSTYINYEALSLYDFITTNRDTIGQELSDILLSKFDEYKRQDDSFIKNIQQEYEDLLAEQKALLRNASEEILELEEEIKILQGLNDWCFCLYVIK